MVTSNKVSDKKVVRMAEQTNAVVPQRTLLGEVNEQITCPLCRGYYIDATTIVECLHSFCRSCIIKHLQVKSYCPVCEMMINSAKPNIKLDKALQDIVYKLVPGLFQKEMERRQQFYASRPGPAASATPEQRGEDTERIIFSPEDVISFSLEFADITDTDSISSKSSDSNEPQPTSATRRYLQCPAVVNISHLKKFLSVKFDIDSSQFAIDILYKRVTLPDCYTLMDIAYIYNWKRNEPMRFFYQIIDYAAIRNRLFDINKKGSNFKDRKSSPTPTEDTSANSPAPNMNDQGSEASSGTASPMPDDKKMSDTSHKSNSSRHQNKDQNITQSTTTLQKHTGCSSQLKKNDEDTEKSQFLNSFELTAKNNNLSGKPSPVKSNACERQLSDVVPKCQAVSPKVEESLKRKNQTPVNTPELKKLKIEIEKAPLPNTSTIVNKCSSIQSSKTTVETPAKVQDDDVSNTSQTTPSISTLCNKEIKTQQQSSGMKQALDSTGLRKTISGPQTVSSAKQKSHSDILSKPIQQSLISQKTMSPLKPPLSKSDTQTSKPGDTPKPNVKKIPDLKPGVPPSHIAQSKGQQINKVRMDLLANNSDPTIDRSKILSQVKTSLTAPNVGPAGDPLKSLFDSCKINIPSSLSITLTDQKLDTRTPGDSPNVDLKSNVLNKNLASASNVLTHKVPSPPVHNYIEILKLPETDTKKQNKSESSTDVKQNTPSKTDSNLTQTKAKSDTPTSAKGPVPNLKPIADTKLGKQSGNYSSPITFQQTFEQQLQSLQADKKTNLPKNKAQVPKLVPATPKAFSAANKLAVPNNKPNTTVPTTLENKSSAALDLSTPHNIQSQLSPQQTKAFETMQSIANLAKKQNLPVKQSMTQNLPQNVFSTIPGRSLGPTTSGNNTPVKVPTSNVNQIKLDKINPSPNKGNQMKPTNNQSTAVPSSSYQITPQNSPSSALPSPRSQTRSPSSSPKLVIAEEKQSGSSSDPNINQSNQISSTQLPINIPKSISPKAAQTPGPSKLGLKPVKPLSNVKISGIRQPITPSLKPILNVNTPSDFLTQPPLIGHHELLRQQMEIRNAWLKAQALYKNITHQTQHDFNKEKQ